MLSFTLLACTLRFDTTNATPLIFRFYNMKVLSRGKIREAPSPITWVAGLLSLQQEGGWDHGVVIQQWNEQASKSERLTGGRFMTVKNVLELEPSVRSVLIEAINTHGWWSYMVESCFGLCVCVSMCMFRAVSVHMS